jgi:hypothetical protein
MTSLFPPSESLVVTLTSRLGTENSQTFFLRCRQTERKKEKRKLKIKHIYIDFKQRKRLEERLIKKKEIVSLGSWDRSTRLESLVSGMMG